MKTVNQILNTKGRQIHSIRSDASVYEAMQLMAHEKIGSLVVIDDGNLEGIVSERDYARKIILKSRQSKDTPVRDIMTREVIYVTSDGRVDVCMSVMTENRIRHLVVRNEGQISGVISIGDVVKAIIEDQQFTIEELERYISS